MTKKIFKCEIQATPILEGEEAEQFWDKIQREQDQKVSLVPTPKLKKLRDYIVKEAWAASGKREAPVEIIDRIGKLKRLDQFLLGLIDTIANMDNIGLEKERTEFACWQIVREIDVIRQECCTKISEIENEYQENSE